MHTLQISLFQLFGFSSESFFSFNKPFFYHLLLTRLYSVPIFLSSSSCVLCVLSPPFLCRGLVQPSSLFPLCLPFPLWVLPPDPKPCSSLTPCSPKSACSTTGLFPPRFGVLELFSVRCPLHRPLCDGYYARHNSAQALTVFSKRAARPSLSSTCSIWDLPDLTFLCEDRFCLHFRVRGFRMNSIVQTHNESK